MVETTAGQQYPGDSSGQALDLHLPVVVLTAGGTWWAGATHDALFGEAVLGVILAGVFLWFFLLFAKSIFTARGVKYNWLGVVIVFGTIGLAIYVVFFVQP